MSEQSQCSKQGCEGAVYGKGLCKSHYFKQYNAANKERRAEYARKYYRANKERMLQRSRDRYAADPETRKARAKEYRDANPERKKEMDRKYREAHLDEIREYDRSEERLAPRREYKRQRYVDLKLEVLLAYGDGSCADCGYRPDDVFELEVHHINNDGVAHRKALINESRGHTIRFYEALKELDWPNDPPLETLCANCHKKKTIAWRHTVS